MDHLAEIVARVFDIPVSQVNDDLSMEGLEVWTSLNHLLLISEIEQEMQIEFTSDEVVSIKTFRDIRIIASSKQ